MALVQFLGLAEVCQVLVVGEHLDQKGGTVKIVSPRLQGSDNSKEFPVVDIVALFCRNECLGEVGAGVPFTVGVSLEEDGP